MRFVKQSKMYESTYYCNLNDYSQEFHYYPFVVKIDRCVWSFNTLNDLSNKVRVPNKTENVRHLCEKDYV